MRSELIDTSDEYRYLSEDEQDDDDDNEHDAEMNEAETSQRLVDHQEDPAFIARKKLEQRAQNVIRQVELIEDASREGRKQQEKFQKTFVSRKNTSIDSTVLPPRLVSISTSSTSTFNSEQTQIGLGSIKDWMHESIVSESQPNEFQTQDITTCHPVPIHSTSLADDLSSNDEVSPQPTKFDNDSSRKHVMLIDELVNENRRLREMVSTCCTAALNIQTNADLKIVRLEMELAHLRQQYSEELATNSRVVVLNQSLRKQLNEAASDIIQKKHQSLPDKKKFMDFMLLHQRELAVEKHLNELIISRNQAVKDSTYLKKMILLTCFECRKRMPLKRRPMLVNDVVNMEQELPSTTESDRVSTPTSSKRPTYQSSARQLLKTKIPSDRQVSQKPLSPITTPPSAVKEIKSCLKRSSTTLSTNNNDHASPTSTAIILNEDGLELPKLPRSNNSVRSSGTTSSSIESTDDHRDASSKSNGYGSQVHGRQHKGRHTRKDFTRNGLRLKRHENDVAQQPLITHDDWSNSSDTISSSIPKGITTISSADNISLPSSSSSIRSNKQKDKSEVLLVKGKSRVGALFFGKKKK